MTEDDVHGYAGRVCFKTGPPERVGVELEWLVAAPDRPAAPVRWEVLAAALDGPLPGGSKITFEPGGQLELSSPPGTGLAACLAAMTADVAAVRAALDRLGLAIVPSAVDPWRSPRRQVRSDRYDAMERYFDARGPLGRIMMCSTAAVQVNLDAGADAADVARRWALLHAIGPTMVAAFANSPVHAGRPTGWRSYRQAVWQRLDPPRTGPPHGDDPAAAWARYTLDAPVLAIPGEPWRTDPGLTFRQWLTSGAPPRAGGAPPAGPGEMVAPVGEVREVVAGRPPLAADLAFHASTLFPPVRPRGWLEVRYVDALPPRWWPVPVAVLTALTADRAAGDAALAAVAGTSAGWLGAARDGLSDPTLARAACGCFEAALDALRRAGDDTGLVEEYRDAYVARGRCPADEGEPVIT